MSSRLFDALRKHRLLVTAVTLAVCLLSLLTGVAGGKEYQATSRIYFNVAAGNSATDVNQAATYLDRAMASFEEVVTTPLVLDPVVKKLKLDETTQDLGNEVTTTVQSGSTMMDVSVTDSDAQRAADKANAISQQMVSAVSSLSPASKGQPSTVNAKVLQEATVPQHANGMSTAARALLGLLGGLVLGLAAALIASRLGRRFHSVDEVQAASNLPVASVDGLPAAGQAAGAGTTEQVDALRSDLQVRWLQQGAKKSQVVLVCDARSSDDATSVSRLLAQSFAASGASVALVDAGAGRAAATGKQGASPAPRDGSTIRGPRGVDLVAGPSGTDALGPQAVAALVDRATANHDVVLVDAPDLVRNPQARIYGPFAGTGVLVTSLHDSSRSDLQASAECLESVVRGQLVVVATTPEHR